MPSPLSLPVSCAALSLAVALLLPGCKRTPEAAAADNSPPLAVRSVVVRSESIRPAVTIPGTVRPAERAIIAAKISGVIESLPLILGQAVQRGDLLARINAPEYAARVAQSRAQLE